MEAGNSSQRKTRRSDGPITTPLECFRQGKDSESMRNSLAELSMRLVDAEDREEFRKADGVTAIGRTGDAELYLENISSLWNHVRLQSFTTLIIQLNMVVLSRWEEFEVLDSLQFTLVAICHASIESEIAAEMLELGALETLFGMLGSLPPKLENFVPFILESFRNLCMSDESHTELPTNFIQSMWELLLSNNDQTSAYCQELSAEVLTNVAAIDPVRAAATPEKLSATLSVLLQAAPTPETANFAIAVSDLLCNLCCDQACCLLLICELDTRRPRDRLKHSGVVYLGVRNGQGYRTGRDFNARGRIGSVHGIASPNVHASVRVAAFAAPQARQFRQKRAPTLFTVHDEEAYGTNLDNESQIREASPVVMQHQTPGQTKRKMNLHLSLDKLEKPVLPMMMVHHEEPKTDCGPRRKSVLFDDNLGDEHQQSFGVSPSSIARRRRASSVTLSMNSPEAAEFIEVAHDGPQELGERTKRVKKLGKGAGGTVFLSLYLPTLKLVAVKEVVVYQEEDRHMVKRELHALHENLAPIDTDASLSGLEGFSSSDMLKHHFLSGLKSCNALCPYLVTFYGAFLKPAKCAVSVVMEFMDMGSVQDLLDANITVSEDVLRHAAFCCITALAHMHSQRMVHRDVKPANILINRNGEFKVADFGLAGTLAKSNSFFSDFTGTMMYMAPERISGAMYTCVSDVWSLGITLFSLATGAYPFTVDDVFFGLEEAICHATLPLMPNRFSPVCRDFIKRMLNRDPDLRLSSEAALTHPFISGYENSTQFRNFYHVWKSLELKRAIDPEDTRTIVNLAVEYSYRYPNMVNLPPEVTGAEPVAENLPPSPGLPEKYSFFHRFNKHLGQASSNSDISPHSAIERLAGDCDVFTEYLLGLFHEVSFVLLSLVVVGNN